WYKLYKYLQSIKVLTLAMCGIVFIILSMFIFIFGFHDLLTFSVGETYKKPTFTQQYAWVIETIVFGLLGSLLLFLAERTRKKLGMDKSVYPVITIPSAYVFLFTTLFISIIGFHNFLYTSDYTDSRGNLAWIIETLVYGFPCLMLFYGSDSIRKKTGEVKSVLVNPVLIASTILLIATVLVYIFGVNSSFWDLKDDVDFKWFIEALVFALPCAVFMLTAEGIRRKEDVKESLIPEFLIPASAVLLFASVTVYFTAIHMSLYDITEVNYSWIIEFILFIVPCAALLMVSEKLSKDSSSVIPYFTVPLAYILLFASLVAYIIGIHLSLWESEKNFIWILELAAFIIPSIAFLMISTGIRNNEAGKAALVEPFILATSSILTVATVFTYIIGMFMVFADLPWNSDNFLLIILESILFALPAAVLLLYADRIRMQKPEMKSITSWFLIPAAYMLLLAFSIVYMGGIFEAISPSSEKNIMLIPEALLFLLPAVYLLWKTECILKKEGATKSLLKQPLRVIGSFFIITSILFVYIFGLHGVFSDLPLDSDRFLLIVVEVVILGLPAAVFLILADLIRRKEHRKKSVLPSVLEPISYLLLISFTLVYLFGVHDTVSDKRDFMWIFEVLLFAIPGFYFLWRSDVIRRGEGSTKSLFVTPLYAIGGLFIVATLISFISGFNNFLYSDEPSINWFIETMVYLISAVIPLYLADRLKTSKPEQR
ncbi:MAG: hypothetical protein U9Q22_05905, partial [Candidatus Altiarchaeota archaeon]|nr:hypothetical protein [Candidatus Altiarchaeota archaeon]